MQRSNSLIRFIIVLALIAILCYMGFKIYDTAANPLQTIQAVNATALDSAQASGYVVRDERILSADGILAPVSDGKKIAAGGTVAISYKSEASLEKADKIAMLEARATSLSDILSDSVKLNASKSLSSLRESIASQNFNSLEDQIYQAEYCLFDQGFSKEFVQQELDSVRSQLSLYKMGSSEYSVVTADSPGVFSTALDGFTNIGPDDLTNLTPDRLSDLFSSENAYNGFGKMVYGTRWYYAAVMSSEDAARLSEGKSAKLSFSEGYTDLVSMQVDRISSSSDGKCVVVFSCDKGLSSVCSVRSARAEIIFSSQTGILIPETAVYDDEEGNGKHIFVLVGLQAREVHVDILCSYMEDYVLVEASDGSTLNTGVEIITVGKNLFDKKVVK